VKFHRLLIVCFLFAFTGQLVLSVSISKKAISECSDSDDDTDDSEDTANECWDGVVFTLPINFTENIEKFQSLIAWNLVPLVSAEWHNAIDNPPEMS
jgi:hypothetical protein